MCMKETSLMLTMLIPGPKSPAKDIDVYLQPLIKELQELWKGVWTKDAAMGTHFQMKAALLWTINDFPARNYAKKEPVETNEKFELNWSKRSIFWDLEYWPFLKLKHNLDVMHIEKNALEALLNTLLQNDKTKDTVKARQDLETLKVRKELWLVKKPNGKLEKPHPKYSFTTEGRKRFCKFIKGVRLPDGFGSNFKQKVTADDNNITGMKSHDWQLYGLTLTTPEVDADDLGLQIKSPDNEERIFPRGYHKVKSISLWHVDAIKYSTTPLPINVVKMLLYMEREYSYHSNAAEHGRPRPVKMTYANANEGNIANFLDHTVGMPVVVHPDGPTGPVRKFQPAYRDRECSIRRRTRGRRQRSLRRKNERYLDMKSMQDQVRAGVIPYKTDQDILDEVVPSTNRQNMSGKGRKLPGGGSTSRRRGPQAFPDAISREELDRILRQKDQEAELLRKQTAEAQQRAYLAALKADAAYQNSETMYGAIVDRGGGECGGGCEDKSVCAWEDVDPKLGGKSTDFKQI
ncbi:hypothetical protein Tco_0080012 [Tanacetum coccineum]